MNEKKKMLDEWFETQNFQDEQEEENAGKALILALLMELTTKDQLASALKAINQVNL